MRRFSKTLTVLLIIDLACIIGVFCLCVAVDKESKADSVNQGSGASLTMEDGTSGIANKGSLFDESIFDRQVIASGEAVGIYMKTDGVMVVDVCSFKNDEGNTCCPVEGLLETGDYITGVDGVEVSKRSELLSYIASCGGEPVDIEYVRNGTEHDCTVQPVKNESGNYLLGAWVKDDVSGIGTVTFIDGTSFMALGHSVSDVDTGLSMRCSTGGVYTTNITHISRSYSSEPGRLQGNISYSKSLVGIIDGNSESGIYGHLDASYCSTAYVDAEKMYIARGSEVTEGKAYIYSRMTGELKKYEIEIEYIDSTASDKNVEFHVTDDELIELTGGVVQGMSGSPIVQNGKLVGAVTHVFVDDPTRGYGIFAEVMVQ